MVVRTAMARKKKNRKIKIVFWNQSWVYLDWAIEKRKGMRMVENKATTTKPQKTTPPCSKTIKTMVCWTHGATKHFVTINTKRTFPPRALPWMVKQTKMPLKRRPPLLPLPAASLASVVASRCSIFVLLLLTHTVDYWPDCYYPCRRLFLFNWNRWITMTGRWAAKWCAVTCYSTTWRCA